MKTATVHQVLGLVLAALSVGCGPEFIEPWEVKEPLLLGARVVIDGDDTGARSRPKLGETFALRQFIATPRKPEQAAQDRYSALLELCFGVKLSNGTLACGAAPGLPAGLPFANEVEVVSDDELRFNGLQVPSLIQELPPPFDEIDRIVLFGAVCVDGKAERVADKQINEDPLTELFRCNDNEKASYRDPLVFSLSVLLDLARPGDDNRSPSFECDAAEPDSPCARGVQVSGEAQVPGPFVLVLPKAKNAPKTAVREAVAWPAWSATDALPWDDCAASEALPKVRAGSGEHSIRVRFDKSDRERYEFEAVRYDKTVVASEREELIVSHAVTDLGGELARFFSVLEREVDDADGEIELTYTPPDQSKKPDLVIPASGRLVRIYFTLRDERGGLDFTTRELCLLPP